MFNIGDIFIYGANGVCKISDIKKEKFAGEVKTYYLVTPYFNEKETIFVPVDNEILVGKMKRILEKTEMLEMIKSIPSQNNIWTDNINLRKEEFKKIIKGAKRMELLSLLKTLYERKEALASEGKSLSVYDEKFMYQAKNIIHGEIAIVFEMQPDEVEGFIEKTIKAA